jgi:hypothetical protein
MKDLQATQPRKIWANQSSCIPELNCNIDINQIRVGSKRPQHNHERHHKRKQQGRRAK